MNLIILATEFYDAAWDLAERLTVLPTDLSAPPGDAPATPAAIHGAFKKAALPFLDLTGKDIPQQLHIAFDQIDTSVRESIFPGAEILQEEWDAYRALPNPTEPDRLRFASMCAEMIEAMEMTVIPLTSRLVRTLRETSPR
jgi:hypothetical protein